MNWGQIALYGAAAVVLAIWGLPKLKGLLGVLKPAPKPNTTTDRVLCWQALYESVKESGCSEAITAVQAVFPHLLHDKDSDE